MNDQEIKLECVSMALGVSANSADPENKDGVIDFAKEIYEFVSQEDVK